MMPLNITNRNRAGVIGCLEKLRPIFLKNQLLLPTNQFKVKTTIQIWNKTTNGKNLCDSDRKELADYISCSGMLHLGDAWSFLSRATLSSSMGDEDSAIHLGYYAELRATMSILASEGVGVFNGKHFCVNINGRAMPATPTKAKRAGTHHFCWDAFESWANSDGWPKLSTLVCPAGVPIAEWVNSFPNSAATKKAIGNELLTGFGIDIKRFGNDRNLRNEASYQPTAFRGLRASKINLEMSSHCENAELLVSNLDYGNCSLSIAILACIINQIYKINNPSYIATRQDKKFKDAVATMCQAIPQGASPLFQKQLLNAAKNPPQILTEALGKLGSEDAGHHRQVLARATILCFLSSLFIRDLNKDAGIKVNDIFFWLSAYADDHGVFDPAVPTAILDLWQDLEEAITEINKLVASPSSRLESTHKYASAMMSLCRYERLLVLGLAT